VFPLRIFPLLKEFFSRPGYRKFWPQRASPSFAGAGLVLGGATRASSGASGGGAPPDQASTGASISSSGA
jgi:hypothetical protein